MSPINILHFHLLIYILFFSRALSRVNITHLPGFSGPLPFRLETGYETVGEDTELFYYFFPSERNPSRDPLLIWTSGGPGCSALNGILFEIGPVRFLLAEYDGSLPTLVHHPFSWTKIANIIFLDSPVGTGFSFSKYPKKANEVDDITSSKQICEFLKKWYNHHPEFLSSPLYIGGDSYAGKTVPLVAYHIATAESTPLFSNLKGYIIGNPVTDSLNFDNQFTVLYARGMGIISSELYKEIEENCEGELYYNPDPHNVMCVNSMNQFLMIISEVHDIYILGPKCWESPEALAEFENKRSLREDENSGLFIPPGAPDIKCKHEYEQYLSYYWANNENTRNALHIKNGTVKEWLRCKRDIPYTPNVPSAIKYHHYLIQRGYKALVYSGNQDMMIPFLGTEAWIRSLNFSTVEKWRSWDVDGQIAGYTQKFMIDLTFATVTNAGHGAPTYQPENCFAMFDRWISQQPL